MPALGFGRHIILLGKKARQEWDAMAAAGDDDWSDEWDSEDSNRHQDRIEAGEETE